MTRTILNWSELLEDYRGKSVQKEPALKKWSDIGRPGSTKKPKHISIEPQNSFEQSEPNELNTLIESRPTKDIIEYSQERILEPETNVTLKIKNVDFNNDTTENPLIQHQVSEKKISLAKLLYDTRFQDSETIPSLYGSGQATQTNPNRLSERDTLLLGLLEQNFQ